MGRYVGVVIPGEKKYLTLCGVEAYENDFLEKIFPIHVNQSSSVDAAKYPATIAVDGSTACPADHYTLTNRQYNAWWMAEFESPV